jgi:hypothetical protein
VQQDSRVSAPRQNRQHLLARCEQVELRFVEDVCKLGSAFATSSSLPGSFISLIIPIAGRTGLEVGLVGDESVLGIS